jgi:S-adenosylmethionine hydrolase
VKPLQVFRLSNSAYHRPAVSKTFHGRDIFAPVAAHLSCGVAADCFGERLEQFMQITWSAAAVTSMEVQGEIVYIDGFGNLFTNITAQDLAGLSKNNLACSLRGISIHGLASHYAAAAPGDLVALINSWEVLEIALCQGNAQQHCGARIGDKVTVCVV